MNFPEVVLVFTLLSCIVIILAIVLTSRNQDSKENGTLQMAFSNKTKLSERPNNEVRELLSLLKYKYVSGKSKKRTKEAVFFSDDRFDQIILSSRKNTHGIYSYYKYHPERMNRIITNRDNIVIPAKGNNHLLYADGYTWHKLYSLSEDDLKKFRQIVVEYSELRDKKQYPIFKDVLTKLNKNHQIFHVTYDNSNGIIKELDGYKVPSTLKLSYIRKDTDVKFTDKKILFPQPGVDKKHEKLRRQYNLHFYPFI